MLRDTRRAPARRWAGLPIGLDWVLDEAGREFGLDEVERDELEQRVRVMLADKEGAR